MEIQDIIQGLSQAEINAITAPEERTLIVNTTLNQAVVYVNGTFKQASFVNTDTDGNACVYDAGSGIAIKNRLGSSKTIRYNINYS